MAPPNRPPTVPHPNRPGVQMPATVKPADAVAGDGISPPTGDGTSPPTSSPATPAPNTFTGTGELDFLGNKMPLTVAGVIAGSTAPAAVQSVNGWAVVLDLGSMRASAKAGDWSAAANAMDALLTDLGTELTDDQRASFYKACVANVETKPIVAGPPAKA